MTSDLHASPGVLCAGGIVHDTLVESVDALHWGATTLVDSLESRVGGSAANTAGALGILGTKVRLAGTVGADEGGAFVTRELRKWNVDLSAVVAVPEPTAATVVLINSAGNRQFLHRPGASARAFADGLPFTTALCEGITHFHLASFFVLPHLRAQAPAMLQSARQAGLTTSLDTSWDPHGEWLRALEPSLPATDILFMNEDETERITGSRDPSEAARAMLRLGVGTVVLKQGSKGCAIYTRTEQILCPAFDVSPRDTTGAGDCFVAGFLSGWTNGASLHAAGTFGNALGALSVQHIGALTGILGRAEVERWIAQTPLRPNTPPPP